MARSHVLFEAGTIKKPVELLFERLWVAYIVWSVPGGQLWAVHVDWEKLVELGLGRLCSWAGFTDWTRPQVHDRFCFLFSTVVGVWGVVVVGP